MTSAVLYVVCCAAPPALSSEGLIVRAQARGWDVCLICTPTAARWLQADLPGLANLTRHPVRSQYKLPEEPDLLPPADAIIVESPPLFDGFAGLALSFVWHVPNVIRLRFLAYQDPWSKEMIVLDGQPTGMTVSEGPGYQIQQSINSIVAGGLSGTGLGFGKPEYVPLAHSDFIFAAIVEELGAVTGLAVLFLFILLMLRITRVALLLPEGQVFERLLLIGICIHFFIQVFIMVSGTLNLLPLTGITIPFLSLGGMALLVNLVEIGMVLSAVQRLESNTA